MAGKDALICVLTDRIDEEILAAGSALKIVANIAVGYDNIDVPAAGRRGIIATNTPDVLTEATAELTWALILGITRRVVEGDRLVRADGWKGWTFDFMLGSELRGKQLGIIGAGRIGRAVAAKAPAFGMTAVFARRPGSTGGSEDSRVARRGARDVGRHFAPRAGLGVDAASHRPQGVRANEAVRVSRQYRARVGRRRGRARVGARRAAHRRRGARRVRASRLSRPVSRPSRT